MLAAFSGEKAGIVRAPPRHEEVTRIQMNRIADPPHIYSAFSLSRHNFTVLHVQRQ
jgi:hypothetical protein